MIFLCLCLRLYQDLMFVKYWWDILDLKNRKHAVNLKGCKNSIWLQNRFDHIVLLPSLFFLQICSIFLTSLVDLALIENIFSVILEKGDRTETMWKKIINSVSYPIFLAHISAYLLTYYFCLLFWKSENWSLPNQRLIMNLAMKITKF